MWTSRIEQSGDGRILKVMIEQEELPLSYRDVLSHWQNDADFRTFFTNLLVDAPFAAFRWETPPITLAAADRAFEFVLLDSPGLARKPDPQTFAAHFREASAKESVISFTNLGKDATLVVPCPVAPSSAYGHPAAFLRQAPDEQKHELWKVVGRVMQQEVGSDPIWLSTAGVSWLHVRLDRKPKYYGYEAYRNDGLSGQR